MSAETIAPQTLNAEELAQQRELMAADYYSLQQQAEEQGKPVDGPMVAGAGLGYDKILTAGYRGYDELSAAATAWRARQDERDTAAMRADAKTQRHNEAETHAAAWRADIDAGREQRQGANERIAAISYRKKLENGGELGLKRNAGLRDKLRAEAIAEAGAEGHNVVHLAPRYAQVPRNPEAEARTSELGNLLKEHDREVLSAQAKLGVETPEEGIVHKITLHDLDPITDPSQKGMRARFQKLMGSARKQLKRISDGYNGLFDQLTDRVIEHPGGDLNATREPLHKAVRNKVNDVILTGSTAVAQAQGRAIEYFADQEKGKRRRTLAAVAGVGLVTLSAVLTLKGMHDGSGLNGQHGGHAQEAANNAGPTHGHNGGSNPGPANHTGNHNPDTGHNGQPQPEVAGPSERLHAGDTIWGDTSEYLSHTKFGHSQANIQKVTAWVLHNQHISWEQARHLPVGYHFELPPHDVLEQLLNPKK